MSGDKDIEDQIGDPADMQAEESFDSDMMEGDFESDDFGEGDEFVDEDWDGYEDEEYEEGSAEQDAAAAAKSKRFNNIIIGITVVVAMGVGGMKFMGAQNTAQQAATAGPAGAQQQNVAEFNSADDAPPEAPYGVTYGKPIEYEPEPEKAPTPGLIGNPAAFDRIIRNDGTTQNNEPAYREPHETEEQPPMPAPITPSTETAERAQPLTPMPSDGGSRFIGEATDYREEANEQTDTNPFDSVANDNADTDDIFGTTQTTQAAPVEPVSTGETDLPAGASPFDSMPAQAETSAQQAQGFEPSAAIMEKLESLDVILERLDAIEDTNDELVSRIEKLEKAPRATKQVSTSSTTKKSSSATTAKSSQTTSPVKKTSTAVKWVLKAAQPGQAMVSKSGENDMISIRVGDNLPGIGRISSITLVNGRWLVEGTQGTIKQ